MRLRARRDGRARSFTDFELPLMGLLAVVVGLGIAMWLNGLGTPEGGEVRPVNERPEFGNPREALAVGAAKRAAAQRRQARVQRVRAARRLARRRAAAAAFVQRRYTGTESGSRSPYPDGRQDFQGTSQTYTQQTLPATPAPKQDTAPAPKQQPSKGGGGGGGGFDDSG
jgi:hypothetical protein